MKPSLLSWLPKPILRYLDHRKELKLAKLRKVRVGLRCVQVSIECGLKFRVFRYNPQQGICGALKEVYIDEDWSLEDFKHAVSTLHQLWWRWPKFSGHHDYPVPAKKERPDNVSPRQFALMAEDTYQYTKTYLWKDSCAFWTGEYGELRMDLLNFLLDELETQLRGY